MTVVRSFKKALPATLGTVLTLALLSIGAGTASAVPPNFCVGHVTKAKSSATRPVPKGDYAVDFVLACAFRMTGFSILSNTSIEQFDASELVFDREGILIPTESFACEGDQPGFGFNCNNGVYSGGFHRVRGTFLLSQPVCAEPRLDPKLIAGIASVDKKGVVLDSLSGPFNLGRVRGCPASHPPVAGAMPQKKVKR